MNAPLKHVIPAASTLQHSVAKDAKFGYATNATSTW